ncbi:MAG: DciA family protein [Actinomycetota bacterium]
MSSPNDRRRLVPGAARSGDAQDLGAVLDELLQQRPWHGGLVLGDLARRWSHVVGERLAQETRPGTLSGDVLTVVASSAAWATQIGFLARDVARRANEVLGEERVRTVHPVVNPDQRSRGDGPTGRVGGGR